MVVELDVQLPHELAAPGGGGPQDRQLARGRGGALRTEDELGDPGHAKDRLREGLGPVEGTADAFDLTQLDDALACVAGGAEGCARRAPFGRHVGGDVTDQQVERQRAEQRAERRFLALPQGHLGCEDLDAQASEQLLGVIVERLVAVRQVVLVRGFQHLQQLLVPLGEQR